MIEIIREESGKTGKQGLPKDIKQIGKPDIGDRIYVENQVYQYLHPHESAEEKKAYVLLGRFETYSGRECVFAEAAIRLREMEFDSELPLWNDHTWAYIYKQLKHEYDSMVIVGWALDIRGQLPNMTARLEKLHQSHFGGAHQILFRIDSLEREEAFYGTRDGHLYRRDGFYIYYKKGAAEDLFSPKDTAKSDDREDALETKWSQNDIKTENSDVKIKTDIIQSNIEEPGTERNFTDTGSGPAPDNAWLSDEDDQPERECKPEEEPEEKEGWFADSDFFGKHFSGRSTVRRGNYRSRISGQEERQPVSSYASTFFLLMVVCLLGVTAYLNNEKMAAMEETLTRMSQAQAGSTDQKKSGDTETPEVKIEHVNGTVKKQEEPLPAEHTAASDGTAGVSDAADGAGGAGDATNIGGTAGGAGGTDGAADQPQGGTPDQAPAAGTAGNEGGAPENAGTTDQQQTDPSGQPQGGTPDQPQDGTPDQAPAAGSEPAVGTSDPTAAVQPDAATAAMAEAQTYLSQGYYVVQKGDSLVGICRRIYQTTAMMDKLCEVNGIEDENTIYAGQKLILPN